MNNQNTEKDLANYILDGIEEMLNKRLENLGYSFYVDGKILTNNSNGTYNVQINQETYVIKAIAGLSLLVGDIVKVLYVNGNASEKYIHFKRP